MEGFLLDRSQKSPPVSSQRIGTRSTPWALTLGPGRGHRRRRLEGPKSDSPTHHTDPLSPSPTWCLRGCGATPRESHPASFSSRTCVLRPAAQQRLFLNVSAENKFSVSAPMAGRTGGRGGAGNTQHRRNRAPQKRETEPGNGEQPRNVEKSTGKLYNPPLTKQP